MFAVGAGVMVFPTMMGTPSYAGPWSYKSERKLLTLVIVRFTPPVVGEMLEPNEPRNWATGLHPGPGRVKNFV